MDLFSSGVVGSGDGESKLGRQNWKTIKEVLETDELYQNNSYC